MSRSEEGSEEIVGGSPGDGRQECPPSYRQPPSVGTGLRRRPAILRRDAPPSPAAVAVAAGRLAPRIHSKLSIYAAALTANTARHRRKFSQVGYIVTARLGLRKRPSNQQIVDQAKTLCGRYIRARLRYCALKTIGLQRLKKLSRGVWMSFSAGSCRSTSSAGAWTEEVLAVGAMVRHLGMELERAHPKIFGSCTANLGVQMLGNEAAVKTLFQSIGREMFRSEVTWGRVVALYAVSGALALDCVRMGRPEFALCLVEAMGTVVDRNIAGWIARQGGWVSLLTQFQPKSPKTRWKPDLVAYGLLTAAMLAILLFYVVT